MFLFLREFRSSQRHTCYSCKSPRVRPFALIGCCLLIFVTRDIVVHSILPHCFKSNFVVGFDIRTTWSGIGHDARAIYSDWDYRFSSSLFRWHGDVCVCGRVCESRSALKSQNKIHNKCSSRLFSWQIFRPLLTVLDQKKKLVSAAASRLKWHSSFRPFHIVACIAQEVAYGELNRAQRQFPSQPILYRIEEIQKTECCLRLRSIKMVNFHFRFLSSVFVMENLEILIEFVLDNFMRFSSTPIQMKNEHSYCVSSASILLNLNSNSNPDPMR